MLHLAWQPHFIFQLRKPCPEGKLIRAIRYFWFIPIHCYPNDHHGVVTWRTRMTVIRLHTLERRNYRKGFGICIFSYTNQSGSTALPVLQSLLSIYRSSGIYCNHVTATKKKTTNKPKKPTKRQNSLINSVANLTLCSFKWPLSLFLSPS